MNKKSLLKQR